MVDKVVDDLNQIWTEQDGEAVRIGFTRTFLNTLDQCWHILPANNKQFKRKAPLITVETNDGLISILSPVDGFLQQFDKRAQNFPDRLTEDDVILHLTTKRPAAPRPGHGRYNDHVSLPAGMRDRPDREQERAILQAMDAARIMRAAPVGRRPPGQEGVQQAVLGQDIWANLAPVQVVDDFEEAGN